MRLFLLLIFAITAPAIKAQDVDIKPLIGAWKVADNSQSLKAQAFYDSLKLKRDTVYYRNVIKALRKYLEKNNNRRLKVRALMYEALGAREYGLLPYKENAALAMEAIKLAYPLKDEQLNAELYALYADMIITPYDYILYNLKAIEIQRKIGFKHFAYVQNRFFGASDLLYRTGDYHQSISYGKEGLSFWNVDVHRWDRRVYIIQMDIIGASYKKLGSYDSAYYYYKKIYDALLANPFKDTLLQKLWVGIAQGNIGQYYAEKGDFAQAMPLMYKYLENSREVKDSFNIAIAQNELGEAFFAQKQYEPALTAWRQALQITKESAFIDQLIPAYEGIAQVFRKKGNTDSAFYYYDKYYQAKENLQKHFRESSYANVSARLAFDNLQNSFDKVEFDMIKIRNTRNAIIAGIVLLTVIVLLLYNRRRLKETIKLQEAQQKYRIAQSETEAAREQIALFKRNVAEKDKLINALSHQTNPELEVRKKELGNSLEQFTLINDDDWESFRSQFVKAYPGFTISLRQKTDSLTAAEEKLAILIYLQLNSSLIAQTLGISRESVARAKRRLKSRLLLRNNDNLEDFIAEM